MTLGPVVACSRLAKHKIVRPEDLAKGARTNRIHGAGLQVHENCAWHILGTGGFIVVYIDALQLEITIAVVRSGRIYTVLIRDYLPEFTTDLVTALTGLNVYNFTHFDSKVRAPFSHRKNGTKKNRAFKTV